MLLLGMSVGCGKPSQRKHELHREKGCFSEFGSVFPGKKKKNRRIQKKNGEIREFWVFGVNSPWFLGSVFPGKKGGEFKRKPVKFAEFWFLGVSSSCFLWSPPNSEKHPFSANRLANRPFFGLVSRNDALMSDIWCTHGLRLYAYLEWLGMQSDITDMTGNPQIEIRVMFQEPHGYALRVTILTAWHRHSKRGCCMRLCHMTRFCACLRVFVLFCAFLCVLSNQNRLQKKQVAQNSEKMCEKRFLLQCPL